MKEFLRKLKRSLFPVYSSPVDYWRRRYGKFGSSLVAPGCAVLDETANQKDYETKWSHIEAALLRVSRDQQKRLLDAGCGLGAFTGKFLSMGYSVSAVDFAHNAIEAARKRVGERVHWYVGVLGDFAPGQTFDIVVCIDVLFHITDDQLQRRAVRNLAGLTGPAGYLLIQDHLIPESDVSEHYSSISSHVRWRSVERYTAILGPEWHLVAHDHYELPMERNTKDLLIFTRTGAAP